MTVSRALSNHPNVLKETREMVQQRAREMGYVKNAAAKAMRGDGTRIVGLLLPNIINEFYARFANAMALACEEESLQLIIHLTGDDVSVEADALDRLQEVQARGVVMVPAPGQTTYGLEKLRALNVVHLIRQADIGMSVPAILIEDAGAIIEAVTHLAAQGHSRIAYIGADQALSSGRSRLSAFCRGLADAGLIAEPDLLRTATPSTAAGHAQMTRLLEAGQATAVVCGGVEMSNGALQALLEGGHGLDAPVAFVGYGDASLYAWIGGGVTTIGLPTEQLAASAASLLAQKTGVESGAEIWSHSATLIRR
jgi:LacI family transcriptional regulator